MARKFTYHSKLYLGESITGRKLDKIKKKLEHKQVLPGVYLITPAKNPQDQLEIFNARQLSQPHYRDGDYYVVGIAGSHEEAVRLVERMVQECLKARGDCVLKEFLL